MSLPSNEKGFKDKLYWTRDQAHPAAAAAARAARRTPPHTSAREQVHLLTPTHTLTLTLTRGQVHLLRRLQKELVGRVRSLRFFEAVRTVQRGGSLPGLAAGQLPLAEPCSSHTPS